MVLVFSTNYKELIVKKDSRKEIVVQVLSETFEARDGHRGVLTRTIILAGRVIEAGSLAHFTQEAGGVQSSLSNAHKKYHPLDVVIHFGNQEPGRSRSTVRLRASGSSYFVESVRDRRRDIELNSYRMGLTQRA